MKFLHSMVRISDIDKSIDFYCNKLGLIENRRIENTRGKFTLIFLAAPEDKTGTQLELTYNWENEQYDSGRNFGHLAFSVENIYEICENLLRSGVTINRPPRDGRMAFIKSPDQISIELLQKGEALTPKEPWVSMENKGKW